MFVAYSPRRVRILLALTAWGVMWASSATASETIEYVYDARGRLIEVKRVQQAGNVKATYEYDRADNRTKKEVTPTP